MNYPIYIFFGLAPSFIWLLFFLRKDSHPESNKMILKIFLFGMLIAILAALVEIGIYKITEGLETLYPFLFFILYNFIGVAFVEEFLKYLVIKEKVLKNPEFDEPVDAILYMIIAALGFAALENILVLLPALSFPFKSFIIETISISSFRFVSATFLHALASGIMGYFLVLSLWKSQKRFQLIVFGLIISSLLHGIYNISIIKTADNFYFILIPIILLTGLAFYVSSGFKKAKKIASTCKLDIGC